MRKQPWWSVISLLFISWMSVGAELALAQPQANDFDVTSAQRFADLALACVHKEYPNKLAHSLNSDADVAPPRKLTPAFYGCYDWHSSVHGHWLLVRLARTYPNAPFAAQARAALQQSLTATNILQEAAYLNAEGRTSFERPYGLAWLLQLGAELREWEKEDKTSYARELSANLRPLELAAVERLKTWLPKLSHPVRSGEHSQTAFALGLIIDYARTPCLAEADVMRRVLNPSEFAAWLHRFLPQLPASKSGAWLRPEKSPDRSDPKLAHIDGLNLSRAWMLEGIASVLPARDPRLGALQASIRTHRSAGLAAVTSEHYEGGHWLGSFAVYLTTQRGLARHR